MGGEVMAYRNGTYIAFHARGTTDPTNSDIKYYNLLKAWTAKTDDDFTMINSHDKTAAVRDSSKRETLLRSLTTRLRNSKSLLLIISQYTKLDTDWVPFEIEYAIDSCQLPVIAAYTGCDAILSASTLKDLWPHALATRINGQQVKAIHIPFKKEPISAAVNQFNTSNHPKGALSCYVREAYEGWGLI